MATVADWVEGARPRTLPAAVSPVALGTGAAVGLDSGSLLRASLAAGVALALQVGVNYANDYSDGIRGTDDVRTGPPRLTGGGAARPRTVRLAAFASFAVAGVLGLWLVALAGTWWLLAAGAVAVLAAWGYTGGASPYGYRGLGEVAVFVFFGLLATLGTTYTQALTVTWQAVAGATGVGLIACALLMVNNVRDVPTDTVAGKRTLAVRLGDRRARWAFVLMITVPLALGLLCAVTHPWAWALLALVPWAVHLSRTVLGGASGRDLIPTLRDTGFFDLAYGLVLGAALAL
ncbi:1,4-dihydroxy-2-naphthoate polyprenyltransferase [Georgenia sp. 10Sc9-8]|uniref:1,4-dihydroxy-2-naphthoate octaprenyltransferase n=1 Tax=Georgenia halotolerans TaxID=3028317 RepID=A0ABT5U0B7_9MICO|nr:1,4-dihydroxy-2-naphthoate polyprenyltransferase [Georgenia halotolerans]